MTSLRKVILNLFARQSKMKLLAKGNAWQLTPKRNVHTEKMSTNKKYRYCLKARIKLKYPHKILFISTGHRIQEVIVSSHCWEIKAIAESIQYPPKRSLYKKLQKYWLNVSELR